MKKLIHDIKEVKEVVREVETTEEVKDLSVAGTGELIVDLSSMITKPKVAISNPIVTDLEDKKVVKFDITGLLTMTTTMDAEVVDPTIVGVTEVA